MARKKKEPDVEPTNNGAVPPIAVTEPLPEAPVTQAPPPNGQPPPTGDAKKNRPAASFSAYSDRTTKVEVNCWWKLVKVSDQEEYTQYSLTLSRAWRDKEGAWQGNAAFRIHDLPVLLYLLQQAYNWCLSRRTDVKIGDEPLPF